MGRREIVQLANVQCRRPAQNKKRVAEQGQCRLHLQQQEAQEKQVATLTVILELIQNNFTKYIFFDARQSPPLTVRSSWFEGFSLE